MDSVHAWSSRMELAYGLVYLAALGFDVAATLFLVRMRSTYKDRAIERKPAGRTILGIVVVLATVIPAVVLAVFGPPYDRSRILDYLAGMMFVLGVVLVYRLIKRAETGGLLENRGARLAVASSGLIVWIVFSDQLGFTGEGHAWLGAGTALTLIAAYQLMVLGSGTKEVAEVGTAAGEES